MFCDINPEELEVEKDALRSFAKLSAIALKNTEPSFEEALKRLNKSFELFESIYIDELQKAYGVEVH